MSGGVELKHETAIRRTAGAALAMLLSIGALAAPASAADSIAPYDGKNPFNCELQQAGRGTSIPHPEADPLCVEYDKTNQDVTGGGSVEFLLGEPERFRLAAGKCFYLQHDHWTGSVAPGGQGELWHWDGTYFWDFGRGVGGLYAENFRFGGSGDYAGGSLFDMNGSPDPRCAAMVDTPEEAARVYRGARAGSGAGVPGGGPCQVARGRVRGRRLGPLALGMSRRDVFRALGLPRVQRRGYQHYCLIGGGSLRVGYASERALERGRGRVRVLLTTSRAYGVRGVGPGASERRLRRRIRSARRLFDTGSARVWEAERSSGRRLLFGTRRGKVVYLAIADSRRVRTEGAARAYLRRAR